MLIGVRIDEDRDQEIAHSFFLSLQSAAGIANKDTVVSYDADLYGIGELQLILADIRMRQSQAITYVLVHNAAQQQLVLKNMGFIIVVM